MSDTEYLPLSELMDRSGVVFGTSGARGLGDAITDKVAYAYTTAFIQYLRDSRQLHADTKEVGLAGDFRPSTGRIMAACAQAVVDAGLQPLNCGKIPAPALAYFGVCRRIAAIMVTGSHIPADRNGIKFTTARGEISKTDEAGIRAQVLGLDPRRFDAAGHLRQRPPALCEDGAAKDLYLQRYLHAFPAGFLSGLTLLVYSHSSVGAAIIAELLERLGAEVIPCAPSPVFVPVDNEAIRPEDHALAREWMAKSFNGTRAFAMLSADGDADRPLLADEGGRWLRSDILGIMTAHYLGVKTVVATATCNTALELSGYFRKTMRTKVGSPWVMAAIEAARQSGEEPVAGYEANGGFLLGSAVQLFDGAQALKPLLTRDAVINHLAWLGAARREKKSISGLLDGLPRRFTASDRLREFPSRTSRAIVARLSAGLHEFQAAFPEPEFGRFTNLDLTDGVRAMSITGDIIHLRASGNAPEFRCYVESGGDPQPLLEKVLKVMGGWR